MSNEITFTIAEISKLNLGPGDVLNVKVMGDEFDDETMYSLQSQFKKLFPNNTIAVFLLPRGNDIQLEVVKTDKVAAPAPVKDCSIPTNYCNDCACGKKERIEAEAASEYDIVDEVQETIDAINNGTYKPDQE